MHKKRIRDSFYYYTTIRNGEKTDSVYLGRNFFEARKKEIFLKNIRLNLIVLFLFLVSIGIVFADTIPINVRPLSGGSIQASAAFDYQFNFTSNLYYHKYHRLLFGYRHCSIFYPAYLYQSKTGSRH